MHCLRRIKIPHCYFKLRMRYQLCQPERHRLRPGLPNIYLHKVALQIYIPRAGRWAGVMTHRQHAGVGRHSEARPVVVGLQHGQACRRIVGIG